MSTAFRDILEIDAVTSSLAASTKEGVLAELARLLARTLEMPDSDAIRRVLLERERLASTGVGSGVAIPHGRLAAAPSLRVAIAVHKSGVYFDAIDGQPVHVFVAIVGPDADPSAHLRLLARASRILRDARARESLLAAATDEQLFETFLAFDRD